MEECRNVDLGTDSSFDVTKSSDADNKVGENNPEFDSMDSDVVREVFEMIDNVNEDDENFEGSDPDVKRFLLG